MVKSYSSNDPPQKRLFQVIVKGMLCQMLFAEVDSRFLKLMTSTS